VTARADLTGLRFDRWTVVGYVFSRNGKAHWNCRCECGTSREVAGGNLRGGLSRSCGCLNLEVVRQQHVTHGENRGGRRTSEYTTWKSMRQRCTNPKEQGYRYYGARGISICERWGSFKNFLADMGRRPGPGYSIDRIDNDGNYEAENCRWATQTEQRRNSRTPAQVRAQLRRATP